MSKIIQRKAAEQAENIKIKEAVEPVVSRKRKAEEVKSQPVKAPRSKATKKKADTGDRSSVIYIGHLPQGFYEVQLKKFFMQFGIVRKLKLFRSAKTGGSRGFAFIQFESPDTAQTVSEAMHGYFLHDRQLVSHVVPVTKQHEGMWKLRKPSDDMVEESEKAVKEQEEKKMDTESVKKRQEEMVKRLAEKQSKLNKLGIDFQIPVPKC
jgi:nucleolar protein 15